MLNKSIRVKVAAKQICAQGIVSFELAPVEGEALPPFTAGSHIDVTTPSGLIRQYSLYNAVSDQSVYKIAVLGEQQGRGGSLEMHNAVEVGTELVISEPRNHFPLIHEPHTLLFAGGIGVTPILSMAETLHSEARNFTLHYSSRSREAMAFCYYLENAAYAEHCHLHFDDEASTKLDINATLENAPPTTHLYVCGPQGYMDFVIGAAKALGWDEHRIHFEYFSAPEGAIDISGDGFQIKIASTGQVLTVSEERTPIEVLAEHGIDIPVSCEQGMCGTCLTKVLDGEPDHRDMFLTDDERAANNQFTPCCSRAKSAMLVLDL